uniref:Uncharacterized protein n=1 Tax=Rhizophora mucronata TaxID=61149 RepID=A0A2P2QPU9_RHIMU
MRRFGALFGSVFLFSFMGIEIYAWLKLDAYPLCSLCKQP